MSKIKRIFYVHTHPVYASRANFFLVRAGRRVDVYFGFLLLDFGSGRRVYHRGITFLLFRGRIDRCLLLLTSHEQRHPSEQVNIISHITESCLGTDLDALI
jgi:hypothetical protein